MQAGITAISLSEVNTLIVALVALQIGIFILKHVGVLRRLDIPAPVIGAVVVSLLVYGLREQEGIEVQFATRLRDLLLLVFFATIGLSAKLSALKAGGRPLLILCGVTLVLLLLQNVGGILVAWAHGAQPFYGILVGRRTWWKLPSRPRRSPWWSARWCPDRSPGGWSAGTA
jgi:ESS family glutamate:Na+ symporter